MKRKLSTLERLIEANLCYRIALEGEITAERLRASLDRLQRKHPALRMLMREENGELSYELEAAGPIPVRVVGWVSEQQHTQECEAEVRAAFPHDQPQLRVVWLRRGHEVLDAKDELLITSAHRVCDGLSMFVVIRELLQGLHSDEPLTPYPAFTVQDVIGDLSERHAWKRKLAARAVNALLALLPSSSRAPCNRELHLQWTMGPEASERLRRRCASEEVPLHAAMLVALGEALSVLGKRAPAQIESPISARRGRPRVLKKDRLFFGGSAFRVAARQDTRRDFWVRARAMAEEMQRKIDASIAGLPANYRFCEMLTPPSTRKLNWIAQLSDRLSRKRGRSRISLSNLGNITLDAAASPLRVHSFFPYAHSFYFKMLDIAAHTLHGQLHFTYIGDEACLPREQVEALGRALTDTLHRCAAIGSERSEANPTTSTVTLRPTTARHDPVDWHELI